MVTLEDFVIKKDKKDDRAKKKRKKSKKSSIDKKTGKPVIPLYAFSNSKIKESKEYTKSIKKEMRNENKIKNPQKSLKKTQEKGMTITSKKTNKTEDKELDTKQQVIELLKERPYSRQEILSELSEKESELVKLLPDMDKSKEILKLKVSRQNVYYLPKEKTGSIKEVSSSKTTEKATKDAAEHNAKVKQLEKELKQKQNEIIELKHEIKDYKEQIRQFEKSEILDADSIWEPIAWEMARILAEQKGLTTDEVLEHFKGRTGVL